MAETTRKRATRNEPLVLGGKIVEPGTQKRIDLTVAKLPVGTSIGLSVIAIRGRYVGPTLVISAAVHGDEINGVEIIRNFIGTDPKKLHGTLLLVPVVNAFGFTDQSRYLPDRRDLNRSFPGSARGSLASRLAHMFVEEVMSHATHMIDLHTGSLHRTNLPQVRANLKDDDTRAMAEAFAAPVYLHSNLRSGSMRATATKMGIPMLLFEAGEPHRYNDHAIQVGKRGILRVLRFLGMRPEPLGRPRKASVEVTKHSWKRSPRGGMLRLSVKEGDVVQPRQQLGIISSPYGEHEVRIRSPGLRMVIGHTLNPCVNRGDAIFHLGHIRDLVEET